MKQKPRWTLEMLTASLAVLCGLLVLVLLVQRPTAWPALLALVVLWGVVVVLFRCQLRKWVARWMCGGSFEGSKLQFSLEPLSQPAALLSGETVLWYNAQFRTRLLNGQDALVSRVQKVLPGLDLQQCRKQEGQLLTLADGMWSVHSSTVPGDAESMTLLVLNEETALRKVEAEYKASRPGYLVFLVDGSKVLMPRSQRITCSFPSDRMYSAAISHSSMVLARPLFKRIGLLCLPTSRRSLKFCMFLAPICMMSA